MNDTWVDYWNDVNIVGQLFACLNKVGKKLETLFFKMQTFWDKKYNSKRVPCPFRIELKK